MISPSLTDVDQFRLMMYRKRSVVRISIYAGIPLVSAMAVYNFIKGSLFVAILNCAMLLIVVLLGFVIKGRVDEKLEYRIFSILSRLFSAAAGIALLYEVGFQSNLSRITWCYIYPLLVFFVAGAKEGMIWVSIFYGILAFVILHFDLRGITLSQLQELRSRFLVSFPIVCMLSIFLEHGFRHAQQRLLHHQRIFRESENRFHQAYEELNIEIRERKQAEEALQAEKQRFQTASENSPFGIVLSDQDGTYKYINPKFRELFGYDLNDVPDGKTWFRKAYPDPTYRHHVISTWMNDNVLGSPKPGEKISRTFTVTCKDGTEKIINFFPVKLETGEFLTSSVDFTVHKKAEEALRRSEEAAKRLSQENAVMAEIGRIISSTLNIDEVYERFAEEVRKLIPFDRIVINTIDTRKGVVTNVYIAGKEIADRETGVLYPIEGSGSAEIARTKSTLLIQTEDFDPYQNRFPMLLSTFQTGFRSIMNVPILSKGEIAGGLLLRSLAPHAYTEEDVRLAERVANQIAGAISNAVLLSERKRAEEELREKEERLQALMDSSPIGISWSDTEGNIEYINRKFHELFGYTIDEIPTVAEWRRLAYPDPAYRKTVPSLVAMLAEAKKEKGEATPVEVTPIEVTPTCKDGSRRWVEHTGAFASNRILAIYKDITERKQGEEKLRSLSLHDPLTGLYNRIYFEEEMSRIEKGRCDAVGIVSCDVDGLKLVNDTLGHDQGDNVLVVAARVIRESFRKGDLVARMGGDEFSVLLSDVTEPIIENACQRIREAVADYNATNPELPLSISVGYAISNRFHRRNLKDLFKEADNNMYRRKLYQTKSIRSTIVKTLINTLQARDFTTEKHVIRLEKLVTGMATLIGLPESMISDLSLLAKFHDIGKVGVPDSILFKRGSLTAEEWTEMKRHCEIGYRIALSSSELVPIADWILKHHEWWNGQGYPLGIREEEIPIECRVLAIADAYEALTSVRPYRRAFSHEEALAELLSHSGTQFEPKLLEKFVQMLETHGPELEVT